MKTTREEARGASRILTLPPALTDSVLAGVPSRVWFEHTREGINADYENVRVGRAVYTVLADLVAAGADSLEVSPASFDALRERPRSLSLEVGVAGKRRKPPSGFEQAVAVTFGRSVEANASGAISSLA